MQWNVWIKWIICLYLRQSPMTFKLFSFCSIFLLKFLSNILFKKDTTLAVEVCVLNFLPICLCPFFCFWNFRVTYFFKIDVLGSEFFRVGFKMLVSIPWENEWSAIFLLMFIIFSNFCNPFWLGKTKPLFFFHILK